MLRRAVPVRRGRRVVDRPGDVLRRVQATLELAEHGAEQHVAPRRLRERAASDKISQALVDSFMTPIEREDIEALGSALYKIPKQIEKFADRYSLATTHLEHIDFAPRAAMLEQAAGVVVEMVADLRHMNLDRMTALNEKLRSLENEADRLMLELYRDIYSGRLDNLQMFLLKEFFEILEKAIDRCREAGVVAYQIVLKNS